MLYYINIHSLNQLEHVLILRGSQWTTWESRFFTVLVRRNKLTEITQKERIRRGSQRTSCVWRRWTTRPVDRQRSWSYYRQSWAICRGTADWELKSWRNWFVAEEGKWEARHQREWIIWVLERQNKGGVTWKPCKNHAERRRSLSIWSIWGKQLDFWHFVQSFPVCP